MVSVAAFASLDQPVARTAETFSPLIGWASPFTCEACGCGVRCRAGFFPADIRPVDAARTIRIPALIAHGEKDSYIPYAAATAIHAAIPGTDKILRPVHGGDHGNVLSVGSHALYADLCAFFLAHAGK